MFHYGHLQFLQAAKKTADILVVALEPDEFIRKRKQKEPIHTQRQRAEVLAALTMVDYVIELPLFTSDADYAMLVESVRPAVIAITQNDPYRKQKEEQAKTVHGVVHEVTPRIGELSTSSIQADATISSD